MCQKYMYMHLTHSDASKSHDKMNYLRKVNIMQITNNTYHPIYDAKMWQMNYPFINYSFKTSLHFSTKIELLFNFMKITVHCSKFYFSIAFYIESLAVLLIFLISLYLVLHATPVGLLFTCKSSWGKTSQCYSIWLLFFLTHRWNVPC